MKVTPENLTLNSKIIGSLPIINIFLQKLKMKELLDKHVHSNPNIRFSHSDAILLFIRNILIERQPLYNLSEWSRLYHPKFLGLGELSPKSLNDDRVGRSLNALFESDRATMLTEIVLNAVKEFNIDLSQLHNDSTSITVSGQYNGKASYHGKPSIKLKHGHNKDYRPDLKQLVFTLSVSRDGAVPIHFKAYDGNITDDKTHINTWESLRRITGKSNFVYVADCKLCTREQMSHIHQEGGKFITVLPETRAEQDWFQKWAMKNTVPWSEIMRTPNHRKPESKEEFIYYGFDSPLPSQEGYRIIWILSTQKQQDDYEKRQKKIQKTIDELDKLKQKIGKRNLKTKEQITCSLEEIFKSNKSQKWFKWQIVSKEHADYKQKGKGRPGKNTQYIQIIKRRYSFVAMPNEECIQQEALFDGIFPLITNLSTKEQSSREVLLKYKYQPFIEKRHEQLKSVFNVAPVFLKAQYRVESLMFVYFIVLLVNALVERHLRNAMRSKKIRSLPIYPEERLCRKPTTEKILSHFHNQRRHVLKEKGVALKTFNDPLSDLQESILNLLCVSKNNYVR